MNLSKIWLLSLAALWLPLACAHSSSTTVPTQAELSASIWQFRCVPCTGAQLKRYFVQLRDDGTVAYAYNSDQPDHWTYDGDDRWSIEGEELVVSWTNGYSIERYRFHDRQGEELLGTKSNVPGTIFARRLR